MTPRLMELWKPVEGYEGLYEVSSHGRVKALEKRVDSGKCHRTWNEHILCTAIDSRGYVRTSLSKDGHSKTVKIHRLVAEAFISNLDNLPQVNHKDGNKQNNNADNLEWCTQAENMKHAYHMKLKVLNGENNPSSKLSFNDVCYIREHKDLGSKALSDLFGVHRKTIQRIVSGAVWKGGDADVKRSKAVSASD